MRRAVVLLAFACSAESAPAPAPALAPALTPESVPAPAEKALPQTHAVARFIELIGEEEHPLQPADQALAQLAQGSARFSVAADLFGRDLEGKPLTGRAFVALTDGQRDRLVQRLEEAHRRSPDAFAWIIVADNLILELPGFLPRPFAQAFAEKLGGALRSVGESPFTLVKAIDLANAYRENELAAEAQYKGKRLLISGQIDAIRKGVLGEPYVILGAGGLQPGVRCAFASDRQSEMLTLKTGQKVMLRAQARGRLLRDVDARECSVLTVLGG